MSEEPDIVAISETKLKENYPINVNLEKYDFVCKNSITNAGRVGLFIMQLYQTFLTIYPF